MSILDKLFSEESRTNLGVLTAIALVIAAGYLVYRNFSQVGREETQVPGTPEEITSEELQTGPEGEMEGEVAGAEAGEEGPGIGGEAPAGVWLARDIEAGALGGESYTVETGDTLWEIAEGRYGSGFEWGKIRDANKDGVGFLPNGSQALITPGQILQLPD